MRIVYQGNVLADGGNKGSPVGLSVGGSKQVDAVPYIRASHGRVFDRGNKRITIEWEHTRRFADVAEAQHFAARHGDALPTGEATAYITTTGGTAMQLSAAVLDLPQLTDYAGTRLVHRYRLTGRVVSGGSIPAWSAGGAGITFGGAALSGGGTNGFTTFEVNGQKAVDTPGFLRAATAAVYDRRNKLNTIRWEQSRDFAGADAAEQFLLRHGQAVPDGTAALTLTLDGGTVVTLADAVVQVPAGRQISGSRTIHRYEATGRALSATADLPAWIDPNASTGTVNPYDVTHLGETVTYDGETVTYTP